MTRTPAIENLTELLQRRLGLQQAQTFAPEDVVADAIARLTRTRGDTSRLEQLWTESAARVVDGWRPGEHDAPLSRLRSTLEASLVVQRYATGRPKSFRPLAPELVTNKSISNIYREMGRSVVDALWADAAVRAGVRARVGRWRNDHPLARVVAPLCVPTNADDDVTSHLGDLVRRGQDPELARWLGDVVREDWMAWLASTAALSVDEQLETMSALVCLHLHVALLRRLAGPGGPLVFLGVAGGEGDRACQRAAYNFYGYWGDRARDALTDVAREALDRAVEENPEWHPPTTLSGLNAWKVPIRGARSQGPTRRFHGLVDQALQAEPADPRAALLDALLSTFLVPNGVVTKVKDFLRVTGRAVGIVGPDAPRARKRYQLDDRAIGLLARLHAARPEETVRSAEDERRSVDAFLDDVFARYGLVVTIEREAIASGVAGVEARRIRGLLPSAEAMRSNRAALERRLDDLRLVRRYSDASAVIHVV